MNNDELQKAIDDITNNNAAAAAPVDVAAAAEASVAENEQLANEIAPAPEAIAAPSAPVTGAGVDLAPEVDLGAAPAPEVPAEPAMPPMATEAPAVEAPAAEVAEPVVAEPIAPAAGVPEEAPAVSDDATLEEAMKELYPLLDRVELPAKEKFDITLKFGEPAKALELAKQMSDPTEKANALLEIVNKLK